MQLIKLKLNERSIFFNIWKKQNVEYYKMNSCNRLQSLSVQLSKYKFDNGNSKFVVNQISIDTKNIL